MCFSATVSYGAAAVLVPTGIYAVHHARTLKDPYWVMAIVPVLFGIQQLVEGRVWQVFESEGSTGAVPLALAFHFFSHFLWLWWIPLSSYLVEPGTIRRRIFFGVGLFGLLAGGMVFSALLLNPEWMSVEVRGHSLVYNVRSSVEIDLPVPASALYGLVILIPLLFSGHRHIRIFGALIALSIALASALYGYAFVSVWCFFAAVISGYFAFMVRRLSLSDPERHDESLDHAGA